VFFTLIWGPDYDCYNTVVDTVHPKIPFFVLQVYRLIAFTTLLVMFVMLSKIYVVTAPAYYTWYSILFSMVAFMLLFIGSGRQKCYQKKIMQKDKFGIDFED